MFIRQTLSCTHRALAQWADLIGGIHSQVSQSTYVQTAMPTRLPSPSTQDGKHDKILSSFLSTTDWFALLASVFNAALPTLILA